jgi:selenocysteine lyase/cysteine desulfurase
VHWTDGPRFDLKAIREKTLEVGAALVVDGTQSVGALPFDVEELQPDALVCAAYKWLLGPYSIGVGYYGQRYLDGMPLEETWIAREGSEDFRGLVDYQDAYQPGAVRFDVGERSNFILVPMVIAALRLVLEWDPGRIQAYTHRLAADLLEEATALGYAVEEDQWRVGHLFGIRMPEGVDLSVTKETLAREKVSASLRGSALRVAPYLYNDTSDMEALARVLREIVAR